MLLLMIKRFFVKSASTKAAERAHLSPESIVERIRLGEAGLRDTFIADYRPYIAKVTSKFCKRYIDPEKDDEFSIAMIAFNEAIEQFSPESGRSFLGFAETVVRRRLIDHLRKEQRHRMSVPISAFEKPEEEESTVNPIEVSMAIEQYEQERQRERLQFEIEAFSKYLKTYDITFADLADKSPKHADSRSTLYRIGRLVASDEGLFGMLEAKRKLPVKELLDICGVSRKTIERNRKFIIAAALIVNGNFPHLQAYLKLPESLPLQGAKEEEYAEGVGS
ncbi:RNA polymerase sigma factor SigI [Paenibacillus tarimensis]